MAKLAFDAVVMACSDDETSSIWVLSGDVVVDSVDL